MSWLVAAGLAALLTVAPMIGRDWQPQGRYLFGALVPITGLLLIGLDGLLDFDLHPGRANAFAGGGARCSTAGAVARSRDRNSSVKATMCASISLQRKSKCRR